MRKPRSSITAFSINNINPHVERIFAQPLQNINKPALIKLLGKLSSFCGIIYPINRPKVEQTAHCPDLKLVKAADY